MVANCPQCAMSLSIDDTRMPAEPFTVVCPRCRNSVSIAPPPKQEPQLEGTSAGSGLPDQGEVLRGLIALLSGGTKHPQNQKLEMDKWQRRRILLCLDDVQLRDQIRGQLDSTRYEVFYADGAPEATETLHESRAQVIVLSPNFDADHQGGAMVMQSVSRLTAAARRRTYVVLVSTQLRTMDTYLAFANGVNLTIHPEDVDSFQSIFERSVHDFNELYRPFNQACGIEPF